MLRRTSAVRLKLAQLRGESKSPKRPRWLSFRELWSPKWADAFIRENETVTGGTEFTYYLAITTGRSPISLMCVRPRPHTRSMRERFT
jgi:hypothetical protein